MSAALEPNPSSISEDPGTDQRICIPGVGWEGYLAMLRLRGDRPYPRILYLDGDIFLMSPAYSHEFDQNRLGRFVEILAMELDIPCTGAGSTTFRRRRRRGGVEGGETYHLAHEPQIRGKRKLSLRHDPRPTSPSRSSSPTPPTPPSRSTGASKSPKSGSGNTRTSRSSLSTPTARTNPSRTASPFHSSPPRRSPDGSPAPLTAPKASGAGPFMSGYKKC